MSSEISSGAEQMDPDNFRAHLLLAQAYHRMGGDEEGKLEDEIVTRFHRGRQVHLEPGK